MDVVCQLLIADIETTSNSVLVLVIVRGEAKQIDE